MNITHPNLVASWSDEDIDKIRECRKFYATEEQNLIAQINEDAKTMSKDDMIEYRRILKPVIKEYQSYVKASTILIDYFYGKGRFEGSVPPDSFPVELDPYFMILLAKL
jgi:hypothetical protein